MITFPLLGLVPLGLAYHYHTFDRVEETLGVYGVMVVVHLLCAITDYTTHKALQKLTPLRVFGLVLVIALSVLWAVSVTLAIP